MALLRSNEKLSNVTVSSFQSVEKILGQVVMVLLKNERLKRLLYYQDKHALSLPKLTDEQSRTLINNQIKIVPKLNIDEDTKPYIIISLDQFVPLEMQTTFRSISLSFDIFCLYDDWILDDFKLRPYAIAGEIDGAINNSYVNGVQVADFVGAKQLVLNSYIGGISLYYNIETFVEDYDIKKYKTAFKENNSVASN